MISSSKGRKDVSPHLGFEIAVDDSFSVHDL